MKTSKSKQTSLTSFLPQKETQQKKRKSTDWGSFGSSRNSVNFSSFKNPKYFDSGASSNSTMTTRSTLGTKSGIESEENTVVTLSSSQKRVLDAILSKKSVFFTGAAGIFFHE